MNRISRAVALGAVVVSASLTSGCPQSPSSICQRMLDAVDALYTRCGYPYHVVLHLPDGTVTDCAHCNSISDGGNQIVHMCIPWAQNVDCSTLMPQPGMGAPPDMPLCDFSMLQTHSR